MGYHCIIYSTWFREEMEEHCLPAYFILNKDQLRGLRSLLSVLTILRLKCGHSSSPLEVVAETSLATAQEVVRRSIILDAGLERYNDAQMANFMRIMKKYPKEGGPHAPTPEHVLKIGGVDIATGKSVEKYFEMCGVLNSLNEAEPCVIIDHYVDQVAFDEYANTYPELTEVLYEEMKNFSELVEDVESAE
jgi:hypothetical protein